MNRHERMPPPNEENQRLSVATRSSPAPPMRPELKSETGGSVHPVFGHVYTLFRVVDWIGAAPKKTSSGPS